jgi:CubicO group peptidase (beta-lactamase class C family)
MLFQPGADDMGAFAAGYPLDHPPDAVHNYSSGTSNIISRIVRDIVGPNEEYGAFLQSELFSPIGMKTAMPRFDKTGTWIASSYCFAAPRDFARFGLLYMRDGVWDGRRILPEGWVDYARSPSPPQPVDADGRGYGAHWWLLNNPHGTFYAAGYLGQYIFVTPAVDLIIVRSGSTPAERRPHVVGLVRQIIELFAET